MAGLTAGQVVPSFPVFLAFKARDVVGQMERQKQEQALPPDTVENLPDGRIRITSARAKSNWNASITISVEGQWFEVEHTDTAGALPRIHVYSLRPASPGKILRGFEEYDAASAVKLRAASQVDAPCRDSSAKK
jgi:hypothetical protein